MCVCVCVCVVGDKARVHIDPRQNNISLARSTTKPRDTYYRRASKKRCVISVMQINSGGARGRARRRKNVNGVARTRNTYLACLGEQVRGYSNGADTSLHAWPSSQ